MGSWDQLLQKVICKIRMIGRVCSADRTHQWRQEDKLQVAVLQSIVQKRLERCLPIDCIPAGMQKACSNQSLPSQFVQMTL